ncbi:glycosyltransferase [Lyngbya sp. CCY1209]|uniref:glycosyltransferase n=1 Tax=Lyngbya sp. CCY1209 TaxID=2886103 RepID=UPI002D208319|nr:glycosyltransferase [Lyngbya sp. CCY1209]MEB3884950.1 glycosyltransferase [Lyngbya sp. CCY1209]
MVASDFSRGNQFLRNRQFEEAVAAYRSAIGHNPDFYLAHHNLGEALEQLGRWEEAIGAYGRSVELKPEVAWSHLNLSRVLRQVGRVEEAEKAGDRAVAVEPKLVGVRSGKAETTSPQNGTQNVDIKTPKNSEKFRKKISQTGSKKLSKTSLQIVIPSFNRHQLLRRLLKQINREASNFDISVDVFDDGSRDPVVEEARNYTRLKSLTVHRYKNHGKKRYWQLVNHIFEYISQKNVDFFIYMPDDIEICSGFFQKVIDCWSAISDPKKIVLNLGFDNRTQCWTRFERVKYKFGDVEVFKTQWVDMLMLFESSFLEALNYRIEPISLSRWQNNPNLSSGVGNQISDKLHRSGFSLYQVSEYLVSHGDHESMMNPEERQINPLIIADAETPNNTQSDRQNANGKNLILDRVDEYLQLAKLKSEQRLWSEALTLYQQVNRFLSRGDAYFGMGKALMELGRHEEAIAAYQQAITLGLSGEKKSNYSGYPSSRELELYNQLLLDLKSAVESQPESTSIWQLMGDVLLELERREEAVEAYQRVIDLTSNSAWTSSWTHFNLSRALQQLKSEDKRGDIVLVFIPAYNAEATIRDSIYSVLNQTYKFIEIIAIDDCSRDQTFEILKQEEEKNINFRAIQTPKNVGSYNAINYGLFVSKKLNFDFFTTHGADDLMFPEKIETQLREMKKGDFLASITGYARVEYPTKKHLKSQKRGHSMVIYSKQVFQNLGYYDDTRFGGDTEYFERFITCYGTTKVHTLNQVLTIAYFSPKNQTVNNPDNSQARLDYVSQFKQEHIKRKNLNNFYVKNKFIDEVKTSIANENKPTSFRKYSLNFSFIVCGMATLPQRQDALKDTVESILPQVDKLIVYQNGYKEKFDFLTHEKIEIVSSLDTKIDMGDAGKFYGLESYDNCYYFSIDDDLIYPSDYVATLLRTLKKYDHRVIVTCHGRILKPNPKSYYKDSKIMYRCLGNVESEEFVHFGGTGVMAFHTSTIKIDFKYFKTSNMADIWMGLYARDNNIPILVVPHKSGWILHSDKFDLNTTIYEEHKNKDYVQRELIKNFDADKIIEIKKIGV